VRIFLGRPADADEVWCGAESPCDSVAQELVELLIAAMSATARRMSRRLLPAAHLARSTEEFAGRVRTDFAASERSLRTAR
jgi:hypothetical protein